MNKKRVLFVTESRQLASGFGNYAKELLPRLKATGKYELAEFACYGHPTNFENTDWLVYCNAPAKHETEYAKYHNAHPIVQWGMARFEHVCLDFKPDIVTCHRDPWMDSYIADSPFLPFFNWIWMPTIDSAPQKTEWLYTFNRCDTLLAYSEFGIKTLADQTNNRVVPVDCASPAIDYNLFYIIPNKKIHKEQFGLPGDSFIFGTVMRNQKRKMFAELMRGFKQFLNETSPKIAEKSFLYLHTSHPEKQGWDITSLIHEYGLGSKVFCTYTCRACKKYFCAHYRDAITNCNLCGAYGAVLPGVSSGLEYTELVNIYNMMDLYIQYAICLGKDEEIYIKRNNQPQWVPISQVKVGDLAWTHKHRWKPVLNVWENLPKSHNKRMLELTPHSDYETLKATENHEFPAYTSNEIPHDNNKSLREKFGDKLRHHQTIPTPNTYELNQLKPGDLLVCPIDDTVEDINRIDLSHYNTDYSVFDDYIYVTKKFVYPRYIDINKEFCRFIGLFAADGSCTLRQTTATLKVTSHIDELDNQHLATSIFNKLKINNISSIRPYNNRNGIDIMLHSKLHTKIFSQWFKKHDNRQLPNWCLYLPPEKQKEILIGLFMGDGHVSCRRNMKTSMYSTISKTLADQIKHILRRLRIPYTCRLKDRTKDNLRDGKNRKDIYQFEIHGDILNGEFSTTRHNTRNVYYNNNHLIQIKDIQEIKYDDSVWCLTVDQDHTMTTRTCTTNQCEGFGIPMLEASACGVPIAALNYSAMEDLITNTGGFTIDPIISRELETNADRSGPNNEDLIKILSLYANTSAKFKEDKRIEVRNKCMERYTWDKALRAWMNAIDNSKPKQPWNSPPLMKPLPSEPPQNLNNHQFCEWICATLLQDRYHMFNYKMLTMLKNLNFGAKADVGILEPCNQKTLFDENLNIAQRRQIFDAMRTKQHKYDIPEFVLDAHRRLKK